MQIRCPGCAQKFKVESHLLGKLVECGNCERQFRVEEQVITKPERVFPGEKKRSQLQQFSKNPPKPTALAAATVAQPIPGPGAGISFLRLLAGMLGLLIILITGALFFIPVTFALASLEVAGRFAAVAAAALLATGCFLLADPGNRQRALLLGFAGFVVMLVLPFAVPLPAAETLDALAVGLAASDEVREQSAAEALEEMGYGVVERTRAEQRAAHGEEAAGQVVAIWLRGIKEVSKVEVKDFLIRVSDANFSSHLYPRRNGDFLMVLEGVQISFTGLQQQCLRLGKLGRIFVAERTIEVIVGDELDSDKSVMELANVNDPAFYALNLRELESIDQNRASRAAERLAAVAPQKFRPDILRRLIQLLSEGDAVFKGHVAAALCVWSEPGDVAADAAMRAVESLMLKEEKVVPESLVRLLLLKQEPAILPILDELWRADPLTWERVYAEGGPMAEGQILAGIEKADPSLRKSAVLILSRLGSAKSLPVLRTSLATEPDQDLQLAMKKAIAAIEERAP